MGQLSRERILDAALDLIDRDGLEKLSMRRLGAALGVEGMTLYRYVQHKDDLLDGVHERVLAGMVWPTPTGAFKPDAAAIAWAFRTALLAHPNAVPLFLTRPAVTPGSLDALEGALQLLVAYGWPADVSLNAVQSLFAFVAGHVLFHSAPIPRSAAALDLSALDPERYPVLSQVRPSDPDTEFAAGLQLFLGLRPA